MAQLSGSVTNVAIAKHIMAPERHQEERTKHRLHHHEESSTKRPKTSSLGEQKWKCLQDVLKARAISGPERHLLFYPLRSSGSSVPKQISYAKLYAEAERRSRKLATLAGFGCGRPVLLHLDDHWDAILWFWAVLLARGIPVMSSPLSNTEEHRIKHLQALSLLLESPICITRTTSLSLFESGDHTLDLHTVEFLEEALKTGADMEKTSNEHPNGHDVNANAADQPAALMLTSGSTGNAKAVELGHSQILAAVAGKMSMRALPPDGSFLNWIGMDHVAALVETHLSALWLGLDQVHVPADDVVTAPQLFLDLLSRHRVSRTFAPNFFLAKLVTTNPPPTCGWDLSNLAALISGGEANDVETCRATAALLARYGAPLNVVQPGFGMTETCAGCIYNIDCPAYDIKHSRALASLGRCMPGIEMRVADGSSGDKSGDLEVRGAVVFQKYYRNPAATADAFVSGNGWFRTGDRAIIDNQGNLGLIGRAKDVININGVKIVTADIQAALETELRETIVNRVVCFPSRASGAATEQVTVACVPREWPVAAEAMADINSRVVQACMMVSTAGSPFVFLIRKLSLPLLPISTLGKISGAKMRMLFEAGTFNQDIVHYRETIEAFRRKKQQHSSPDVALMEEEILLRADFAEAKGLELECIDFDTPIFELGFTSMDLIRLKHRISSRLGITIAIIMLMKNPTIRKLAAALTKMVEKSHVTNTEQMETKKSIQTDPEYDPVVILQSTGTKTPLWLVHPGVGEVLVFVGLAKHMKDDNRAIYALRAQGFERGQKNFSSIAETVDTYTAAIQQRQPKGPYAIAGYSYGAMLAFEIAKKLKSAGNTVGFLGSFNLPPHIKYRMRQLTWSMCLLHLAQFLGLVGEGTVDQMTESLGKHDVAVHDESARVAALKHVLSVADAERLGELGLGDAAILRWTDVAYGLQSMAVDYEPTGSVDSLDVFVAEPLRVAAASRSEWMLQLGRWQDFCKSSPRLHNVGGGHYTMIGSEHVVDFAEILRAALKGRGL